MDWVDRLAVELHLEALSAHENEHLLSVSREVAHRVERKATPLAMYVIGLSVGSQMADRHARRRDRGRDPRAPPPPAARRGVLTRRDRRR